VLVGFDPTSTGLGTQGVTEALAAHLAGLSVDVVAVAHPAQHDSPPTWNLAEPAVEAPNDAAPAATTSARVWLSRVDEETYRVQVWTAGDSDPWSRDLEDHGDADLTLESIGVVVRGVLGTAASRQEPAPPPVVETPVVQRAPKRRSQLAATLAYRGETFAPELLWHSGVRVGLGWEGPRGLLVDGGGSWSPPTQAEGEVRIQRIPVEFAVGWRTRPGLRVRPGLMVTAVGEALGWSGAASGLEARPGWAWRAGFGAAADVTIGMGSGFFGFGRLAAAGWVRGAQLEVERVSGPQRLLQAAPVSVGALVGVGYQLFFIRNRRANATDKTND